MRAKGTVPFPRLERLRIRTSPGAQDDEVQSEGLDDFQAEYLMLRGNVLDVSVDVMKVGV